MLAEPTPDRKGFGAGCGLWAALLRCVGCNIIATDSKQEPTSEYIDIDSLSSYDALVKYGPEVDVLFVSWGRGHPTEEEFSHFKGNLIITIGQRSQPGPMKGLGEDDGCTSSGCLDVLDDNPRTWNRRFRCGYNCVADEIEQSSILSVIFDDCIS